MASERDKRIADFLFEVGTLRKIQRAHRQVLITDDLSDNIASHSYRVALIGWFLAREEGADPHRVVLMCLTHDLPEGRSNDHNWLHKRYVKVMEDEIIEEQLGSLPYTELADLAREYAERKTPEAVVAKDADMLDELLLLREYEWQGNKEAGVWLHEGKRAGEKQKDFLKTESARRIVEAIYERRPSDWWSALWTPNNRTQ